MILNRIMVQWSLLSAKCLYRLSVAVVVTGFFFGSQFCGAQESVSEERYNIEKKAFELVKQGTDLAKQGKHLEGKDLLLQAAALDPTPYSASIHQNLAIIYSDLGNLKGAVSENELALKFDPTMASAAWNNALALKDLGEYQQAIAWVQRYISMNTTEDPSQGASIQQANGLISKLREQAGNQFFTNPKNPDYLQQLLTEHGASVWTVDKLPLNIYVFPAKNVDGYSPIFNQYLQESLDTWCKASQGKLAYQFVDKKKKANITVEFTSKPADVTPTDGVHMEQGVAMMRTLQEPHKMPIFDSGTIKILTIQRNSGKPLEDDEVKEVCLHEVGHALGLGGHSNNSSDIMYFSVSARQLPGLTRRDKATIARLYAPYPARF